MMRSGKTIDGKLFAETVSTSARGSLLRRYFIDGKPVCISEWVSRRNTAEDAELARKEVTT